MAGEQIDLPIVATITGQAAFDQAAAGIRQVQGATQSLNDTQRTMRKETEAAAAAIRAQRMATTQLGMQISQVGTQMASGTSIGTIFAQQIGDIGYAMSNMKGIMGGVGRFLTGPLGVALSLGAMAFATLGGKADDAKESTVGFAEYAKATMITFGQAVAPVADMAFAPFGPAIDFVKKHIGTLVTFTETALNVVIQAMAGVATAVIATVGRLPAIVKGVIYASINGVIHMVNFAQDVLAGLINTAYDGVKKISAFFGMNLPEYEIKFKPFSTKDSGLGNVFGDINSAITTAVTTKYIDFSKIAKLAPSLVEPSDKKDKKSKIDKDKKDINDFNDFVNANVAETMKSLDEYSKAYADTTRDNVKIAVQAFEEQRKYEEKLKDAAFDADQERAMNVIDSYNAVGNAVADSFKGMITGAQSFGDAFKNIIGSVIDELFRLYVVQQIVGMVKSTLKGVFGVPAGVRAIGGSVQSGQPYMVGERGPEMFVPSRSGSIVPNGKMGSGISISVDARGAADPAAVRQQVELGIAQAAPYIIAAAQNRTLKTAGRTRLPGTIG